jgi:hypothetical protein
MTTVNVTANYNATRQIALMGIRRASVFMGVGVNAAKIDPALSHALDDRTQFVVLPPSALEDDKRRIVTEFESWVIANGLRDMVEAFSLFLNEVFALQNLMEHSPIDGLAQSRAVSRFSRKGIEDQAEILTRRLGLDGRFAAMLGSLNRVRNILAHRMGHVGFEDVPTPDQPFSLIWRTRAMVFRSDGTDISLLLQADRTVKTERDEIIDLKEVERSKAFSLGEKVRITRHELNEICFGMTIATEAYLQGLIEFARSKGQVVEMR